MHARHRHLASTLLRVATTVTALLALYYASAALYLLHGLGSLPGSLGSVHLHSALTDTAIANDGTLRATLRLPGLLSDVPWAWQATLHSAVLLAGEEVAAWVGASQEDAALS